VFLKYCENISWTPLCYNCLPNIQHLTPFDISSALSLSVLSPAHGPDHGSYQKAMGAELKPHFFDGGLAFMFETKYTVRLSKWSRCVVTSVFRMHVGLYMLIQYRSNYQKTGSLFWDWF